MSLTRILEVAAGTSIAAVGLAVIAGALRIWVVRSEDERHRKLLMENPIYRDLLRHGE